MSENKDTDSKIALLIVTVLIAFTVIGVVWFGAAQSSGAKKSANEVVVVSETITITETDLVPTTENTAPNSDASHIVVENGVVQFYFAKGKAQMPAGASEALLDVIAAVNSGKKAVISGYTDASGSAQVNEELSKQRAYAVRDVLLSFNVPEDRIELRKPEALTGSGDASQARRVEVTLID